MASVNRWSPFDDVFNFHREVERVFNQFWNDLPARTAESPNSFRVNTTEDGWHIDVPLPGIDPENVNLEVAGSEPHPRPHEAVGQVEPGQQREVVPVGATDQTRPDTTSRPSKVSASV